MCKIDNLLTIISFTLRNVNRRRLSCVSRLLLLFPKSAFYNRFGKINSFHTLSSNKVSKFFLTVIDI